MEIYNQINKGSKQKINRQSEIVQKTFMYDINHIPLNDKDEE